MYKDIFQAWQPLFVADSDGDLNADGSVNSADILLATQILMGHLAPSPAQQLHMDVAPLILGSPARDGLLNTGDLLLIQCKALGEIDF